MPKTLEEAARALRDGAKLLTMTHPILDPEAFARQTLVVNGLVELVDAALATDDGTVRVPREPTEAMVSAGVAAYVNANEDGVVTLEDLLPIAFMAMLAAHEKEPTDGR